MNLVGKSIIAVAGVAAVWSGGWYGVKSFVVEPEADRIIESIRSGDLFLSYDKRAISGFPFGYTVRYENLELSNESGAWRWAIDGLSASRSAASTLLTFDPNSVFSIKAETFGVPADSPPVIFEIASDGWTITAPDDPQSGRSAIVADKLSVIQKGAAAALTGFRFEMSDLAGDFASESATKAAFNFDIGGYSYNYRLEMPDGTEQWGNATSGPSESEGYYDVTGFDPENPVEFLQGGGALKLSTKASDYSGETSIAGSPDTPPMSISYNGDGADLLIQVENGRAQYGGNVGRISTMVNLEDPSPFPGGEIKMAGMSLDFQFPFQPTDSEAPYLIALSMDDLEIDEAFWAMGDPFGGLKRTPISFAMEFGGDVFMHNYIEALQSGQAPIESPAEVRTVEIRKFDLSGLGLTIGATGDLTITPESETPDGYIDINLAGVSDLLDQLVGAGLVPAAAADQYRAMWPAFMVPGTEPDTYSTKIEAKGGQISVNGQRVQ